MNRDANYYVKTSYKPEDVTLLLKDVTGLVEPQPTEERERLIQAGRHYCEMLPIEYVPTPRYMQVYEEALRTFSKPTAEAVSRLGDKIMTQKGEGTVLVSLARAGIPIGILLKRYILKKYGVNMPHYSISIIRGRGIDHCAMKYMLESAYDIGANAVVTGKCIELDGAVRNTRRYTYPQFMFELNSIGTCEQNISA